ncbi:MAG: GAF domain-containing protein [Anaerolineae bacterium]|nr:GAF domain-containing protein [Anaerolineae bacterium]
MRNSIRSRLNLAFIVLAVGPLLLVGVVLAWQSFSVQRQQAIVQQRQVAQRVSTQVAAFLQSLESELRVVSQVQGLQDLDRDQQTSLLSELLSYERGFDELILLDSEGQERVHLSRLQVFVESDLGSRAEADEFTKPIASGSTYYGPVRFDETTRQPLMTISVPLYDVRSGTAAGVLVSTIRFKPVWDLIAGLEIGEGENIYIVDAQSRIVAHRNPSVVLAGARFSPPEQNAFQTGLGGNNVVLAVDRVRLGDQTLAIVAERAVTEALALAFNTVLIVAMLIVVVLAIAVGLGVLVVRQIVRPIDDLAATAQAISAGDLSRQASVAGQQDEIATLALAFNQMTTQLRETLAGLERRVAERTQGLLTAAEVSRATTSVLDIDELLPQVVELVRERFNLYYVGLFLADQTGEYALLRAGTGEAGRAMLARNHRLRVGGESMIGRCVLSGQADIQLDVGEAAVRFDNPDLPETRSELALPLRAGGQVIGAMTVQSTQEAFFTEEDVSVMQTVADQIANAVRNARLFQQVQDSLESERRAYGELTQAAWQNLLQARTDLGFMSDRQSTVQSVDVWRPEMETALHTGQVVPGSSDTSTLAIPIKVRDQVIGVIDGRKPDGTQWTQEEINLLAAMTEQLNVALESARLYQDTQRTAARERVIGEVTGRIREPLELEDVLKTAVSEIRRALGIDELGVRLLMPEQPGLDSD